MPTQYQYQPPEYKHASVSVNKISLLTAIGVIQNIVTEQLICSRCSPSSAGTGSKGRNVQDVGFSIDKSRSPNEASNVKYGEVHNIQCPSCGYFCKCKGDNPQVVEIVSFCVSCSSHAIILFYMVKYLTKIELFFNAEPISITVDKNN